MMPFLCYPDPMSGANKTGLSTRVIAAAEAVLERDGSVGPLELFQELGWLHAGHVQGWRKGSEFYPTLEPWIQIGPDKFTKAFRHFGDWVKERGLRPMEAAYSRQGRHGTEPLQVTADNNPEREQFYRTHYAPADLPVKRAERLSQKLKKVPDLVVYATVRDESQCSECQARIDHGEFLFMENNAPLCLACADLDHLVFLPSGDTALTRRSKKHSPLSAVVVQFNRRRRRYERQGLLVTAKAIEQAQAECAADAPERAAARQRAAVYRKKEDQAFIKSMTASILEQYPACPPDEARCIAAHAGQRSSGRVGRSAAGQALDPHAIDLAVIAHIRHEHTDYDQLLMQGTARQDARTLVGDTIDRVAMMWKTGNP